MLTQHRYPALLGEIVRRLHREEAEQRAGPPADLVVGKIPDAVGRPAKRCNEVARDSIHAALHVGRERVEPVEFGTPAELEIDHRRETKLLRWQRPSAGAVEAPGGQPTARLVAPAGDRRREFLPVIACIAGAELRVLAVPAVEDVDADAVEAVAARRFEPRLEKRSPHGVVSQSTPFSTASDQRLDGALSKSQASTFRGTMTAANRMAPTDQRSRRVAIVRRYKGFDRRSASFETAAAQN